MFDTVRGKVRNKASGVAAKGVQKELEYQLTPEDELGVLGRARHAAGGATLKAAGKAEGLPGVDNDVLRDVKHAATETGNEGILKALTFAKDNRAQSTGASKAVNLVVGLVVGGLMAAFLLPIAIDEIATVDTTSWDNGAAQLWNILPVIIVLAIFLFFVGLALARSNM